MADDIVVVIRCLNFGLRTPRFGGTHRKPESVEYCRSIDIPGFPISALSSRWNSEMKGKRVHVSQ